MIYILHVNESPSFPYQVANHPQMIPSHCIMQGRVALPIKHSHFMVRGLLKESLHRSNISRSSNREYTGIWATEKLFDDWVWGCLVRKAAHGVVQTGICVRIEQDVADLQGILLGSCGKVERGLTSLVWDVGKVRDLGL